MRKLLKGIFMLICCLFIFTFTQKVNANGNTITSLDVPTGLIWKDGSTSTAKWDAVENANYYYVNVYVYDENGTVIGGQETGTSNTELDVQQEIVRILQNSNINKYSVTFKVKAQYFDQTTVIGSNTSLESPSLFFEIKGTMQYATPQDVTIDDSYNVTFDDIPNADYYALYFNMGGSTSTLSDAFFSPSQGTKSDGKITYNIRNHIKESYKDRGYNGQTVQVSYKVKVVAASGNTTYLNSNYSTYSNSVSFSDNNVIKYATPQNVTIDDSYNVTFDDIPNADYYALYFRIGGSTSTLSDAFFSPSQGTKSDGKITYNIRNYIKESYKDRGYNGQTVQVSYKVKVVAASGNTTYLNSNYSTYSNSVSFSDNNIIKYATPQNVTIDDDMNATFDDIPNADYYALYFKVGGRTSSLSDAFFSPSQGVKQNEKIKFNIRSKVLEAYTKYKYSNETVQVSYRVKVVAASGNTIYVNSEYSQYSNIGYYNPNGSTVINNITLSPNNPVIAVGRSIYIGKTIDPNDAYYSSIRWISSNSNIVSVNNMGKITGITPGSATITAGINSATQTALVSVYEIESNINDSEQANEIIDNANDIIESIVGEQNASNTDITNINYAVELIENGAQNGNTFKVDLNHTDKEASDYSSIESEIQIKYPNMSVAGGYDVSVEMYHENSGGQKYHIGNITKLDNAVNFKLDLPNSLPTLPSTKMREMKLVKYHNNELEEISATFNNDGTLNSSSKEFSDFILLYRDTDIPVEGLDVDKTEVTLNVGTETTIGVTINPSNAANKNYSSISSNEGVATVDGNRITAVSTGETTITFTSEDGNFSKEVKVTVIKPLVDIEIVWDKIDIPVDGSTTLSVRYTPSDTTDDKTVTWKSSNEAVATVNNGVVTAHSAGETIISATVKDKTKIISITVHGYLEDLKIKNMKDKYYIDNSITTANFEWEIIPENAWDSNVEWTSSDESVATISPGLLKKMILHKTGKTGTTKITGLAENGKNKVSFDVYVYEPIQSITCDHNDSWIIDLANGNNYKLNCNILPNSIPIDVLSYKSLDDNVLIDKNGNITINNNFTGSTAIRYSKVLPQTLIAMSDMGDYNSSNVDYVYLKIGDSRKVYIDSLKPSVGSFTTDFNKDTFEYTLRVPKNSNEIEFEIGAPKETKIDPLFFCKYRENNNKCEINISDNDGIIKKKYTINIVEYEIPLVGISLKETSGTISPSEELTLEVIYNPSNTTDSKNEVWTSSNPNVASVDGGKVTGANPGTATITVQVGNKKATYEVTVKETLTLAKIVTDAGFKISNGFVYNFKVGTTISELKSKFNNKITIKPDNGNVSTGTTLSYNGETAIVVIRGDLTGDGRVNSADLLQMRKYLLEEVNLTGAYKEAGIIESVGNIKSLDLLRLRQYLLGEYVFK